MAETKSNQAITAERSPLRIGSNQTQTAIIYFLSTSF